MRLSELARTLRVGESDERTVENWPSGQELKDMDAKRLWDFLKIPKPPSKENGRVVPFKKSDED